MHEPCPIAIVGMGSVFPGASDPAAFQRNNLNKIDTTREVPPGRWVVPPEKIYSSRRDVDKAVSKRACFVEDLRLDPAGLRVDPELWAGLDPLYHLSLHVGRQAFRDAVTKNLDPKRVGVYLAAIALPTDSSSAITRDIVGLSLERRIFGARGGGAHKNGLSCSPWNSQVVSRPASLLAGALGLGGPSFTLDAACASSLYAIKLACDYLQAGKADAMLAGGVSRPECLYTQVGFSQLRALSPSGCCRPFDASADGLVVGEGAGMVLLKRMDDALRDGDEIYAVIRGMGWSNDIAGSLLAADPEGQLRSMRMAYKQAGWRPTDVDFIECHGTGTPVGDAAEVKSLINLWKDCDWREGQCAIGSVKSMIGHLLTAAGAAGLFRAIQAMRSGKRWPTANFEKPNPNGGLEKSPFRVLQRTEDWQRRGKDNLYKAAVSAFGFGGINAHFLLEEWNPQVRDYTSKPPKSSQKGSTKKAKQSENVPLAIVGMDAHFGRLKSLRAFQEAVLKGECAFAERPADRWRGCDALAGEWLADSALPGAYIDGVHLPIGHFRMPPNEISEALPQQLLMLQVVDRALSDAGIEGRQRNERAGVLVGMSLDLNTSNFHQRWVLEEQFWQWSRQLGLDLGEQELAEWVGKLREELGPPLNSARVQGALGGLIASRIAREFSFGGPSFGISAGEVSGIQALEVAARLLRNGELDLAVVGAVDLSGDVRNVLCRHGIRAFSRNGEVRPFDGNADGTLPGEGAAAVVLKRMEDAEHDRDRVYAVVKGIALGGGYENEDGYPSERIYQSVMKEAYAEAGVEPETIGYLETNGSGNPREDQIEAQALAEYFGGHDKQLCALGSVKSNIGHTGAAAGLASLVKTALCLYQEMLPPLVGYTQSAEQITWPVGFHMPASGQSWVRDRVYGPRRAGVSSISMEGHCGHVVLEGVEHSPDAYIEERDQPLGAREWAVFAVEGNGPKDLAQWLQALANFAQSHALRIETLARRWYAQRPLQGRHKRALSIVARSADDLVAKVKRATDWLQQNPDEKIDGQEDIFYSPQPLGRQGQTAFVFPGSGNHYLGMGRTLSGHWPMILRQLDRESQRLASQMMPRWYMPWRSTWSAGWQNEANYEINADHLKMIMGQVAHGVAMSDLVRHLGVQPAAVIGYSLGETTSLFAMRAWRDRDEMLQRMRSSPLFQSDLAGACNAARKAWGLSTDDAIDWRVVVVNRPTREVKRAVARQRYAYLLITNAPDECVIGGHNDDVQQVIQRLNCDAYVLNGAATVHCDVFKEAEAAYRNLHLLETTPPNGVRFYSAAWAKAYDLDSDSAAASIVAQALRGFDFPATIEQAYKDGVRIFVEPGPQASCSRMIDKILGNRPHLARSACINGQDGVWTIFRLLASLLAERAITDLHSLYGEEIKTWAYLQDEQTDKKRPEVFVSTGAKPPQPMLPKSVLSKPQYQEVVPVGETKAAEHSVESVYQSGTAGQNKQTAAGESAYSHPNRVASFIGQGPGQSISSQTMPSYPMPTNQPQNVDYQPTDSSGLLGEVTRAGINSAQAHDAYLRFSQSALEGMGKALAVQAHLLQMMGTTQGLPEGRRIQPTYQPVPSSMGQQVVEQQQSQLVAYPREMCMEFAIGSVAKVLGPEFAEVDQYSVRVRLPDEPLMLVDRIVSVEGEKASLTSGCVVTEHDVYDGRWYLDNGCCPTAIAVEAGQADLFLCSYLGIDLAVKGKRAYRLLDAEVQFHRGLPRIGEVIQYEIHIDRFVKQGEVYLFFFRFEGTVNGQPVLTMRDGCAGFFTKQEIHDSGGVILSADDKKPLTGKRPDDWTELVPMTNESYDRQQVEALERGDLVGCFGEMFTGLDLREPMRLPGGKLRLVHRVTEIDPAGGRYSLGRIKAQADIHPDDWFLTCHFPDDKVMPGTLMYECCLHTLRIYLMRMGWVGEQSEVHCEPVQERWSKLRCRGPVTPETKVVTYEVQIKEFGYHPEPYALADAFMYADERMIVQMTDMSVKLSSLSKEKIEDLWRNRKADSPGGASGDTAADAKKAIQPIGESWPTVESKPPVYSREQILAFAIGRPSEAFGEPYKVFDEQRRIARLPGPPFMFLDRLTQVEAEPWKLLTGGWVEGQYDVPPDAWYFAANRQASMPFAVLLEIALQSCGWLAAYMGSALQSEEDLRFRNLGGTATLYREVFPDAGTLTTRVRTTRVSKAGGMIIEEFDTQIWQGGAIVYDCHTIFGFFSQQALANQVGIRDAVGRVFNPQQDQQRGALQFDLEDIPPLHPDDEQQQTARGAVMPGRAWRMIDRVEVFLPDGGPHGLGFIRGSKQVDPDEWFFKAHFYQDPVVPGSLGLESFLQLLKIVALHHWGERVGRTHRFQPVMLGTAHTWKYRGQVIPNNKNVQVEAVIKEMSDQPTPTIRADGFLKVDGVYIYEMQDFALSLVPDSHNPD